MAGPVWRPGCAAYRHLDAALVVVQGGSKFNATTAPVFMGLAPGAAALAVTGPGSVLNLANTALELGLVANSTVTVDHAGSIAASGSGGNFLIGLGAVFPTDSTMTVNAGGTASANDITVSGSAIGSTGLLSVSDPSSSVTAAGQLLVASGGVVNAANQGSVTADSLRIQSGSITVDSNANLNVTSGTAVLIGSGGTGTFTLHGGETASSPRRTGSRHERRVERRHERRGLVQQSGSIGTQSTGNGIVTVQGGDWTAHGALQIGAAGTGALQLLPHPRTSCGLEGVLRCPRQRLDVSASWSIRRRRSPGLSIPQLLLL